MKLTGILMKMLGARATPEQMLNYCSATASKLFGEPVRFRSTREIDNVTGGKLYAYYAEKHPECV